MKLSTSVRFLVLAVCCSTLINRASAVQFDIPGPVGSGLFGSSVTVLPNGNFVVTDPNYTSPEPTANVGAVYLYDGTTLAIISKLTGSRANDHVGNAGIIVLSNGNFLINSVNWNNSAGAVTWASGTSGVSGIVSETNSLINISTNNGVGGTYAYKVLALSNGNYLVGNAYWNNFTGAATWGNGTSGVTGAISAANSLVGGTSGDYVALDLIILSNGNYLVQSESWNNGVGAVTWCNGTTGRTGVVSSANSLVGSIVGDDVGTGVTTLNNGNYVVGSPYWQNGAVAGAGAVTWCNGSTGRTGLVSTANSLVGTNANDNVGVGITALSNGNYVVQSPNWRTNVGAVTWCNGATGRTGMVASTNSLVGSVSQDQVGSFVVELENGNYVVCSPAWHGASGPNVNLGSVTWGNGTNGVIGAVASSNSLVGSVANDFVGYDSIHFKVTITPLSNGNYVVGSPSWHNGGVANAGAATLGNGTTGVTNTISSANSLVGNAPNDHVGANVTALANGNYVVNSFTWRTNTGAATWVSGTTGRFGVVSSANSLVGSVTNDFVSSTVIALSNGNYVVSSPTWRNGSASNAGAVTWGNGSSGVVGAVSAANSLVGATANDYVGSDNGTFPAMVTALNNGNYIVASPDWHNGATTRAGAVTLCNGSSGTIGAVSTANSLVGTTANDQVGFEISLLLNGNYVVSSPGWHGGMGAATWINGGSGLTGSVSAANSLVGTTAFDNVGSLITVLSNSDYLVLSPIANQSGAVTYAKGTQATVGTLNASNTFFGTMAGGYATLVVTNDPIYNRFDIGYPADKRVSLFGFFPRIDVQQPTNVNLVSGDTRIFGAPIGQNTSLTFIIKNVNVADLTGIGATIDGIDAAKFTIITNPATQVTGPFGSTTVTVRFAPTSAGTRSAALHIVSNDPQTSPFNINLSGKALSSNEDSDGDGMSDAAEFALAALGFDWQVSQSNLVTAYYSNANSAGLYTTSQVEALNVGSPLLERDSSTGLFKLTIGVQKSTNLTNFTAFPMNTGQTTINGSGELEFQFEPPDNAAFFRLESH